MHYLENIHDTCATFVYMCEFLYLQISAGDALSKFEIENQRLIAETDSKINGMLKTLEKTFSNQDKAPSDQVSSPSVLSPFYFGNKKFEKQAT